MTGIPEISGVTPRQLALADQLQAQVAQDIREFTDGPGAVENQLEHAKAVLARYDELPVELVCAAILRAAGEAVEVEDGE